MAGKKQIYKTIPMFEFFSGEGEPENDIWGTPVRYLSASERAAYRLEIRDGKIYDADGNLFDTRMASTLFSGQGRAIFVMDGNGDIYASTFQKPGEFHHSSLLAGGPVAAAGELVVEEGILKLVSDKSGHYRPHRELTDQLIKRVQDSGVDLEGIEIELVGQ